MAVRLRSTSSPSWSATHCRAEGAQAAAQTNRQLALVMLLPAGSRKGSCTHGLPMTHVALARAPTPTQLLLSVPPIKPNLATPDRLPAGLPGRQPVSAPAPTWEK